MSAYHALVEPEGMQAFLVAYSVLVLAQPFGCFFIYSYDVFGYLHKHLLAFKPPSRAFQVCLLLEVGLMDGAHVQASCGKRGLI